MYSDTFGPPIQPQLKIWPIIVMAAFAFGLAAALHIGAMILHYAPFRPDLLAGYLAAAIPVGGIVWYERQKSERCCYWFGPHSVRIQNWWYDRWACEFREEAIEIPYAEMFDCQVHRNWAQRMTGRATLILVVTGSQPSVGFADFRTSTMRAFDDWFGHGEGRNVYRLYDLARWREIEEGILVRLTRPNPLRRVVTSH